MLLAHGEPVAVQCHLGSDALVKEPVLIPVVVRELNAHIRKGDIDREFPKSGHGLFDGDIAAVLIEIDAVVENIEAVARAE